MSLILRLFFVLILFTPLFDVARTMQSERQSGEAPQEDLTQYMHSLNHLLAMLEQNNMEKAKEAVKQAKQESKLPNMYVPPIENALTTGDIASAKKIIAKIRGLVAASLGVSQQSESKSAKRTRGSQEEQKQQDDPTPSEPPLKRPITNSTSTITTTTPTPAQVPTIERLTVAAHSSEDRQSIEQNIFNLFDQAKNRVILVSDQLTAQTISNRLINIVKKNKDAKTPFTLQILVGDNGSGWQIEKQINEALHTPACKSILSGRNQIHRTYMADTYDAPLILGLENRRYKMHNKFIVIDDKVLLGSPNATYNAYHNNVESFVVIESEALANLYKSYYDYMLSEATVTEENHQKQAHAPQVSINALETQMNNFNIRSNVQVCLAPVCNIKNFIKEKIKDAIEIKMNAFLISKAEEGDIINTLISLKQKNARASILINIDSVMYESQNTGWFMQPAIKDLVNHNIRVRKITLQQGTPQGSFHDKLILIKHVRDGHEIKSVIIGSAGLTTDVQKNQNYENMIFIENDDRIYTTLEQHVNSFTPGNSKISNKVSQIEEAYASPAAAAKDNIRSSQKVGGVWWGGKIY